MSVRDAVFDRRSIRAFLPDKLDESAVRTLVEDAAWSPSSCNTQPWTVVALSGDALAGVVQTALSTMEQNPKGLPNAYPYFPKTFAPTYVERRIAAGEALYTALGIARDDAEARRKQVLSNFRFFDAPVGLLIFLDKDMGHVQWAHVGMYMQTLALLAHDRGFGTCMQEFWGMVREPVQKHLGMPENLVLYAGIALGRPDLGHQLNAVNPGRANADAFAQFRGFTATRGMVAAE